MSDHVFAVASGYGLRVIPRAPFRIERSTLAPRALDVEHFTPQGSRFACLLADGEGGYRSKLAPHVRSLHDVLDVEAGPNASEWRIETSAFDCAWPEGFAFESSNFPREPALFLLLGARDELIFVQTPDHPPPTDQLVGPGQRVRRVERDEDGEFIELDYEHEGRAWVMRHDVRELAGHAFITTMQAPATCAAAAAERNRVVARSIRWTDAT